MFRFFTSLALLFHVHFHLVHSIPELNLEPGNFVIHSSLVDEDSGLVWLLKEFIVSSSEQIQGKIELTGPTGNQLEIFYLSRNHLNNPDRLVMHENQCDLYRYETTQWSQQLPGVDGKLLNSILLLGPSFIYRFSGQYGDGWIKGNDEIVRGRRLNRLDNEIEYKLNLTLYHRDDFDLRQALRSPSRIVLSGYDFNGLIGSQPEHLIIDYYLISMVSDEQDLETYVQPTREIGCKSYLQEADIGYPHPDTTQIHVIAKETDLLSQQISIIEIYAEEANQIARAIETTAGTTTDYIYDFNLGIVYEMRSESSCSVYGLPLSAPGSDEYGRFWIYTLFWGTAYYQYLGQILHASQPGYKVKVWEAVNKGNIGGTAYEKVVTTSYLAQTPQGTGVFDGFSPVAATRKAYQKDANGTLNLKLATRRDYYDAHIGLESEYRDAYKLSDCFTQSDDRLSITFHIKCDLDHQPDCIERVKENPLDLKNHLSKAIHSEYHISPLRVVDFETIFDQKTIEMDVTFIEAPKFKDVFKAKLVTIDEDSLHHLRPVQGASSAEDCLRKQSQTSFTPKYIFYCPKENLCVLNEDPTKVQTNTENGKLCQVYRADYSRLKRFFAEKTLHELHDFLVQRIADSSFDVIEDIYEALLSPGHGTYSYEVFDVTINDKRAQSQEGKLFQNSYDDSKWNDNDHGVVQVTGGIETFTDCYRACSKSEEIFCESFSFCEETRECLVSTEKVDQQSQLSTRADCKTFSKGTLSNYVARPGSAFAESSVSSERHSIGECASLCESKSDCHSFQFCDGWCTFGGFVNSSSLRINENCLVYIPNMSHKFTMTGSKVVSSVLHTELDLDLEQCSALCYNYQDEACRSFNFCPKSKSSPATCLLAQFIVSDPNAETTETTYCHNFELIVKRPNHPDSPDPLNPAHEKAPSKSFPVSGAGIFGLIVLFMFIGSILGFAVPCFYMKVTSNNRNKTRSSTFSWSRQMDDTPLEPQDIQ